MNKPYIVCYMMTSVDGRIDCAMTGSLVGVEEYYPLLEELKLENAISGRMTAELEIAEKGKYAPKNNTPVNMEVVSKKNPSNNGYDIIVDTKGTLLWKHNDEYDKPVLIITSEQVSKEYLSYLDEKNIPYIATGKQKIDLVRATTILKETFDISRLGVVGGAAINTAFLDAGLLDEVILLIGAGIDGRASFPPVFNRSEERPVTPLKLIETKSYNSGAVMIRWKTIK